MLEGFSFHVQSHRGQAAGAATPSRLGDSASITAFTVFALLTISISSLLCSSTHNCLTTPSCRLLLKVLWVASAAALLSISWFTEETPVTLSQFFALRLSIMIVPVWLIAKVCQIFNAIPGPLAAKFTVLWKVVAVCDGTYTSKVRQLHQELGPLVQVGPYEYSVSDKAYFDRCSKLPKVSCSDFRTCV